MKELRSCYCEVYIFQCPPSEIEYFSILQNVFSPSYPGYHKLLSLPLGYFLGYSYNWNMLIEKCIQNWAGCADVCVGWRALLTVFSSSGLLNQFVVNLQLLLLNSNTWWQYSSVLNSTGARGEPLLPSGTRTLTGVDATIGDLAVARSEQHSLTRLTPKRSPGICPLSLRVQTIYKNSRHNLTRDQEGMIAGYSTDLSIRRKSQNKLVVGVFLHGLLLLLIASWSSFVETSCSCDLRVLFTDEIFNLAWRAGVMFP